MFPQQIPNKSLNVLTTTIETACNQILKHCGVRQLNVPFKSAQTFVFIVQESLIITHSGYITKFNSTDNKLTM